MGTSITYTKHLDMIETKRAKRLMKINVEKVGVKMDDAVDKGTYRN